MPEPPEPSVTAEDVFCLRDTFLAEHPEFVTLMKQCNWVEWAMRRMQGVRIVERRYGKGGKLLSERDVTPDDPEPEV